jgi:hypothetical protein
MDRVERVARAMCKADGEDPDHLIPANMESVLESGLGHHKRVLNWTTYEREARLFLAALDATKE